MNSAIESILTERRSQDDKWGEQNHDPFTWLVVLMEEVGELSEAALHAKFGGECAANLRREAVQVAAVATAMIEWIDRRSSEFVTIVLNGCTQVLCIKNSAKLSYEEICRMAGRAGANASVTFSRGPDHLREGSLCGGCSIRVVNGMIFNCAVADNS